MFPSPTSLALQRRDSTCATYLFHEKAESVFSDKLRFRLNLGDLALGQACDFGGGDDGVGGGGHGVAGAAAGEAADGSGITEHFDQGYFGGHGGLVRALQDADDLAASPVEIAKDLSLVIFRDGALDSHDGL